jgi:hypothetical protein
VNHHDITADAVKAVPTLAVAATGVLGVDWPTITYMATAIYTTLLIAQFCRRAYKAWQLDRKTARDNAARDLRRRVVEKVVAKREAQ